MVIIEADNILIRKILNSYFTGLMFL